MQSFNPGEAGKITRIECQDSLHTVNPHGSDEMSVMYLDSRDAIIHE